MSRPDVGFVIAMALSSLFAPVLSSDIGPDDKGKGVAVLEERLPGSDLSIQEAMERSNLIVVAKIIDMGGPEADFPGKASYSNARVKLIGSLKGEANGERRVDVNVRTFPKGDAESVPEAGQEYLFFLRKPDAVQLWVTKAARPTGQTLRDVKGLLKAAPLPGSDLRAREAAEYAKLVVVARVIEVHRGDVLDPKGTSYHARIKVAETLKGELAGEHFVHFYVRVAPNGKAEETPEVEREYLIFLSNRPGKELGGIKMLRSTEEDRRLVRGILRKQGQ